jgi:hypothetical protein
VWDLVQLRCEWANGGNASPQWLSDLASYCGAPGWIPLPAVSDTRRVISTARSSRVDLSSSSACGVPPPTANLERWFTFRRVVWIENASSGCRTTRQTGISMSHRPLLGLWPTTCRCLRDHVGYSAARLPGCLRCLVVVPLRLLRSGVIDWQSTIIAGAEAIGNTPLGGKYRE